MSETRVEVFYPHKDRLEILVDEHPLDTIGAIDGVLISKWFESDDKWDDDVDRSTGWKGLPSEAYDAVGDSKSPLVFCFIGSIEDKKQFKEAAKANNCCFKETNVTELTQKAKKYESDGKKLEALREYYKATFVGQSIHANYMVGLFLFKHITKEDPLPINYKTSIVTKYAKKHFKVAAKGNGDAAIESMYYLYKLYAEENIEYAMKMLKEAAQNNFPLAMYELAEHYACGICIDKNVEKAITLYKKAANSNNISVQYEAQYKLAEIYHNGDGVDANGHEAVKWYEKLANTNNKYTVTAQVRLGEIYYSGEGVDIDESEAFEWYHKAADAGDSESQYMTGSFYEAGIVTEKDLDQAIRYYRMATEQDDGRAMYRLAELYYKDISEEKHKEAFELYSRLNARNDTTALYYLGLCYLKGKGVEKDFAKAKELLEQSIELESDNSYMSIKKLAYIYQNGLGVKKDKDIASYFYGLYLLNYDVEKLEPVDTILAT